MSKSSISDEFRNCKAITVVFGNDYLLNTIVENLSQDLSVMSKYRLVNQSFNNAIIHKIKKMHREVVIRKDFNCKAENTINFGSERRKDYDCKSCSIFLNCQRVTSNKISKLFRFLKSVVDIKIQRLVLIPCQVNRMCLDDKILHDLVLKELIGPNYNHLEDYMVMYDICRQGCDMCFRISENCLRYGPLQSLVLKRNKHYESLEIRDDNKVVGTVGLAYLCDKNVWSFQSRFFFSLKKQ
ncbi:F-box domain-containing protein [Caenorhabditis elegans]|uniref:F-box domain-containing protein n=1 Tax=Caenorhabditis elegans TaxID=6239 RepID=A0A0K3AXL9_CAEEL|nr:F-box domain-containing protein [Caenorhabditis elegans]CTQ86748.1 F-box domain-containing protein [Caenorhabditis elegans]|eukprot:NP_001300049.1 Uncharacterized protein CELE_C05E4.15 [Caenorhabditis elegans]